MNTSEFRDIDYELDAHGIVTVTFNTPARKNALSMLTFYELYVALKVFENDERAFAMILTGASDSKVGPNQQAYSSGGYFNSDALVGVAPEVLAEINMADIAQKRTTMKIFACDKPILAAVNGLAIGGAVTLTLAGADFIYLSEHAWMQLPFAKLGINAELGSSFLLPRLLGVQKAKEIMFFADRIEAHQALELGLANAVVPHDELLAFTRTKALQLVPPKGALQAVREMKRLISAPLLEPLAAALDRENKALARLFKSSDFAEALDARAQRRIPVFTGR